MSNVMEKVIPVFYACDDAFVKYTIVSLTSLMENASKEYHYRIHILNTNICDMKKQVLAEMANENFELCFENVTSYLEEINEKLPIRDYYSKTTYYRMFIAEMFPKYEKAIYIDSDTVVLGDISELFAHELGDKYVAAAHEQAMVQVDGYGTYVEEVVGVNRNNYFNAGLLVINCHQFRKQRVLEKFISLLQEYNFVVTQDEDYLNVICHNHVFWLEQYWNTEVFGKIPYPAEMAKILHFIMTSKPWHYKDCRFGEYFWNYAKKTSVYEEIKKVLDAYTDEQRENDRISCERLLATAIAETNREDSYARRMRREKEQAS